MLPYLALAIALTSVFIVYTGLESVRLSFFRTTPSGSEVFVGFGHYAQLLTDPVARTALLNTVQYAVIYTLGTVVAGTAIALAIDRRVPWSRTFRFLIFLPVILPTVFTCLVWQIGLAPYFGWVNDVLGMVNPALSRAWLNDPQTVMWPIMGAMILQFTGFAMIIVLGALQDVPAEVQEAATLDGASAVQRVRHVTLPLIREVLLVVTLLQLMAGFKVFDAVFVMTRGGPGSASMTLSVFVYQQAFQNDRFNYGAAAAVVTSVIIALISMLYLTVFRPGRVSRV